MINHRRKSNPHVLGGGICECPLPCGLSQSGQRRNACGAVGDANANRTDSAQLVCAARTRAAAAVAAGMAARAPSGGSAGTAMPPTASVTFRNLHGLGRRQLWLRAWRRAPPLGAVRGQPCRRPHGLGAARQRRTDSGGGRRGCGHGGARPLWGQCGDSHAADRTTKTATIGSPFHYNTTTIGRTVFVAFHSVRHIGGSHESTSGNSSLSPKSLGLLVACLSTSRATPIARGFHSCLVP